MSDGLVVAGRLAFALVALTVLVPVLVLLITTALPNADERQRLRMWSAACVVILAAAVAAPWQPIRSSMSLPDEIARVASALGVPVVEAIRVEVGPSETRRVVTKRRMFWTTPGPVATGVLAVWLIGTLLAGWSTLARYWAAGRRVRSLPVVSSGAVGDLLKGQLHDAPRCIVRSCAGGCPAYAWGAIPAHIVLPEPLLRRPDEARLVLAHELHHVRNRDFLLQIASDLLVCVVWWNPMTWIVRRAIRREREFAADAAVLESGAEPRAYADALCSAASDLRLAAPMMASRGPALAERIQNIAEWRPRPRESRLVPLATWLGLLALACAMLMWNSVRAASPAESDADGGHPTAVLLST